MREFLAAIIVSLLIVIAGLSHALLRHAPYVPHIAGQQQPDGGLQPSLDSSAMKGTSSCADCVPKAQHKEDEWTEFWPPFLGYRLKVTDTLVAAFTALLFCATWALYAATAKLVRGADRTAERQLRAYVHIEKTNLTLKENVWTHSFRIKNSGHTPAHNVKLTSKTQVVDWNNGRPRVDDPTEVENLGSMGPNGDFFDNDRKINEIVTVDQLKDKTKAVYLVGNIRYTTVFDGSERTTYFRYYVGGDIEYQGGEMSADEEGNHAT